MNKLQLTILAAAVVCSGMSASAARACSAPYVCASEVVMAPRAEVPVNLGGVLLDPFVSARFGSRVQGRPPRELNVTLHTEAQPEQALPVQLEPRDGGFLWVAFQQPLQQGTRYVVSVNEDCEQTLEQSIAFVAGAPVALPASLGALLVHEPSAELIPYAGGASCSVELPVAAVDLELQTPALASVADYHLVVDGEDWDWPLSMGSGIYGGPGAPSARPTFFGEPGTFRVWTDCDNNKDLTERKGLTPGKHTVLVRALLLGDEAHTVDSESAEMTLVCPVPIPSLEPASERGDGDGDTVLPGERSDGGGCSAGAGQRTNVLSLLVFCTLATLTARRARPSRRR